MHEEFKINDEETTKDLAKGRTLLLIAENLGFDSLKGEKITSTMLSLHVLLLYIALLKRAAIVLIIRSLTVTDFVVSKKR